MKAYEYLTMKSYEYLTVECPSKHDTTLARRLEEGWELVPTGPHGETVRILPGTVIRVWALLRREKRRSPRGLPK